MGSSDMEFNGRGTGGPVVKISASHAEDPDSISGRCRNKVLFFENLKVFAEHWWCNEFCLVRYLHSEKPYTNTHVKRYEIRNVWSVIEKMLCWSMVEE